MRREWVKGRSGVVTQLRYAREGVITEEMRHVAKREGLEPEKVREELAAGRLIIPANIRHTNLAPIGIGSVCKCKVNANIGNSSEQSDIDGELEKLDVAQRYGADTVMDLSTGGDINSIRAAILERCTVPLGTVPVYQAIHGVEDVTELSERDFLDVIRGQAEQGVDYITVHVGILREHLPLVQQRVNGIVSRGGSLMATWMLKHNAENPLYTQFDELLDICAEYDVALSLGDGLRPGCLADASDEPQFAELKVLGDLTRRAWARDVQVMVEGPGHIPLNEIEMNVRKQQEYCDNAPFYLLGPLVTDIAAGYDHITSAIGGALAATAGASMLCYVTPMEHLGLPDAEAVREGIIAHRIAAHAADIARGLPGARQPDDDMARARFHFDWDKQFELALDPERARKIRSAHLKGEDEQLDDYCTMCGPKFCAMKISKDLCADVVAHHKKTEAPGSGDAQ